MRVPSSVSEHGINIDVRQAEASIEADKQNILTMIAGREDEVNALMRKQFARAALYQAASKGDLEKTKSLMESEVFDSMEHAVRVADEEGCVYDICEYNDKNDQGDQTAVLHYLLERGCSPNNTTERHGHPALKLAFGIGAYDKVKLLLKYGADPLFVTDEPDAKGRPDGFLTMEDIEKSTCPRKVYKKMLKAGVPWEGTPESDDEKYSENGLDCRCSSSEDEEEEE